MGSGSEMGQTFGAYTGGVHWVPGQTKGQPKLSGRRGVGKTYLWGLGSTMVVTKHHPSDGVEVVTGWAGQYLALQVFLDVCGAQCKKTKNISWMGTWTRGGRLLIETNFSSSILLLNSKQMFENLRKSEKQILTFLPKLLSLTIVSF